MFNFFNVTFVVQNHKTWSLGYHFHNIFILVSNIPYHTWVKMKKLFNNCEFCVSFERMVFLRKRRDLPGLQLASEHHYDGLFIDWNQFQLCQNTVIYTDCTSLNMWCVCSYSLRYGRLRMCFLFKNLESWKNLESTQNYKVDWK